MDPLHSFLSSISPARAKSPTPPAKPIRSKSPTPTPTPAQPSKSRFRRHPTPSASSSNLLVPTPHTAGVSASASTSNLRSPSPTQSRFGKMLAQPIFHLPRSRSPKPPETTKLEVPSIIDSSSSTSLVAPSVPARSPLRGTPRSVASFSSLLDSYGQPTSKASRSGSTLGLGLPTNEEEPEIAADLPSPSVYSPVNAAFPSEQEAEHRVRRSASMRLGHLRMPSTRTRSASVSSPMKYEDGADIPTITPGRRSVDSVPQISRRGTTASSTLPPIRDSAIGIRDLPPTPPPKLHVRMQSEFTLGPEFASYDAQPTRGVSMVAGGSSPADSESSGFETAASHTNNTADTSVPPRSSRPGTSLSLSRPSTSTSSRMVIQLPLPSTGTPSPAQESVGSPSTRTSTSQLSLLVESPEHAYSNKRPESIPEQKPSKRTHALLELLSSERAYASDLALIRDIFLPLAQGKPTTFPLPPSVGSLMFPMHKDPPMSAQDVKIVFGNIEELASFADELSERLELALGSVVPGGTGDDRVGELFCELAPRMTPMYLAYITRHPAAVARYAQLSTNPTPAMAQYLTTTKAMTTSITHAWDIPSLIIKPLQRLLKYPLILQTILENTLPSLNHPDRATLALAKEKTEQVARQVNEGKRRWEVVKGVLESGKSPPGHGSKTRSMFRPRPSTSANGNETQEDLVALEKRVKECADTASRMAERVVVWADALTSNTRSLFVWSRSFQRVVDLDVLLGGDPQGGSEAVRAFSGVAQGLDDLSRELAAVVSEELVPQLHRLGKTSKEPLLLCAHAHTLAGAHYNLINAPYSKSRPSGLLEASQSYLALSAQLREELPRYIDMFERALGIIVLRLSGWQARYFQESERRWREFWIALDVEGDTENSAVETVRIWWSRWESTARQMASMAIVSSGPTNKRVYRERERERVRPDVSTPTSDSASWDYIPPSAMSFDGNGNSNGKGHSRAVSSDYSARSAEFPGGIGKGGAGAGGAGGERGKAKKGQRGGSNLRRVTDTLFGGTPASYASSTPQPGSGSGYATTPFPYSPPPSSSNPNSTRPPSSNPSPSPRSSHHPVLYAAAAIHPFDPATSATHLGLPFLKLEIGDTLEILLEAGHPKEHKDLPIPYDDAPDCMLAARSERGEEGWALASYLMPLASM
ncbi:RhoGEF domain [Rhizoctonia solani]|uniref:RhoGEF domain n=1 Tax=Rhizoctonia solani TaxID=456999 RepID=A0A8H7HAE3_9AGAM|nr:RhoGEF domain [Rhizoctonia solani]